MVLKFKNVNLLFKIVFEFSWDPDSELAKYRSRILIEIIFILIRHTVVF